MLLTWKQDVVQNSTGLVHREVAFDEEDEVIGYVHTPIGEVISSACLASRNSTFVRVKHLIPRYCRSGEFIDAKAGRNFIQTMVDFLGDVPKDQQLPAHTLATDNETLHPRAVVLQWRLNEREKWHSCKCDVLTWLYRGTDLMCVYVNASGFIQESFARDVMVQCGCLEHNAH